MNAGRYASCAQLTRQDPWGRSVSYLAIRILPLGESVAGSATARVGGSEVDRLDLIANRAIGDPMQAWRIADANDAMDPFSLCGVAGAALNLPASQL